MAAKKKILELLSRVELDALEQYAREPGLTVNDIRGWMQDHGHSISRDAAWNWKKEFDGLVMQERFARSGELARAIKGAVDQQSFGDVADAAVMQLTQVVFEQASQLEANGEIDPLDVQRMTRSLRNLVGSKSDLVKLLAEKFDREMKKQLGASPERKLTAEQITAAGKAIFG